MARSFIRWLEDIGAGDTESVGGKNASLGEMVRNLGRAGITVPPGFAVTSDAYRHFLSANNLEPLIVAKLAELKGGKVSSAEIGSETRTAIETAEWPKDLADAICHAYRDLSRRLRVDEADVAVRSSATAEDLPEASFAGQQETFLNIRGEAALLNAARRCFASLFTDRAISYREAKGSRFWEAPISCLCPYLTWLWQGHAGPFCPGQHAQTLGTGKSRRPCASFSWESTVWSDLAPRREP